MTEAAGAAQPLVEAQGGEATRLIALLEGDKFTEADNLTTELAAETATWPDAKCAEKVKGWCGSDQMPAQLR